MYSLWRPSPSCCLHFYPIAAGIWGVFRSVNEPRIPLIITSASVVLNTALGLMLVLGLGPIPSLGVAGAGLATLISQSGRCLALITLLYFRHWLTPSGQGQRVAHRTLWPYRRRSSRRLIYGFRLSPSDPLSQGGAGSAPTSILGGASDGHNSTGEGVEQPAG
jgi:hypothetical protein